MLPIISICAEQTTLHLLLVLSSSDSLSGASLIVVYMYLHNIAILYSCLFSLFLTSLVLGSLQEAFTDAWDKFEKQMLSLYNRKEEEKKKFYTIYYGSIEAVDQKSKAMITDYKLLKKKVPTSHRYFSQYHNIF